MSKKSQRRRSDRRKEEANQRQQQQNQIITIVAGVLIVAVVGFIIWQFSQASTSTSEFSAAADVQGCPDGTRPLAAMSPAEREGFYEEYPPMCLDTDKEYEAVISVIGKGEMRLELFDDEAPLTVNSFIYLAEEGFYDGVPFHRVIQDFMAQTGDPSGTGSGGPGYSFVDETENGLGFDRPGLLAMANSGPATNGSQFFITFAVTDWLNGNHTVFGEIIDGQDVLDSIVIIEPGAPGSPDLIQRIDIEESQDS